MCRSVAYVTAIMVLSGVMQSVQAERYRTTESEAAPLHQLLVSLQTHHEKFEKLMKMRDQVETTTEELNGLREQLGREAQAAKQDREKFENGQLSETQLNKKWHESGRSLKHDREVNTFKQKVAGFNAFLRQYNQLAHELEKFLASRSPGEVEQLMKEMERLSGGIQRALDAGDIKKAKLLASSSSIPTEFGYSPN